MRPPRVLVLLGLAVAGFAAVDCTSNAPLNPVAFAQPGTAGAKGSAGAGAAGASGVAGVPGTAGAPGVAGAAGTAGVAGAAGTAGVAGAPGVAGDTSLAGAGGSMAPGTAGVSGTAGAAGTGGSVVLVCGSPTTSQNLCVPGAYKHAGVCQCQEGSPCVCPTGCTDPMFDDDNCGVCGRRCGPTSTCNGGVCGPPPVNVVPPSPGCRTIDVAVSGGTLFWANAGLGLVQSMPLGGGAVTTLAAQEASPSLIAVADSSVFWLDAGTRTIRRSVAGGAPANVVALPLGSNVGGFVPTPDGTTVYFSSISTVLRVPAVGGTPVVVVREVMGGLPHALALAGNRLAFPTDLNGDVDLATLTDGQVTACGQEDANGNVIQVGCARLGRSQGQLFLEAILTPPGLVIWADGQNIKMEVVPPVGSMGGPFDTIATSDFNPVSGLAMTPGTVYFAEPNDDTGSGGVIYRAPIRADQTAVRLVRGQRQPRSPATGPSKIYWSTSDCSIESTGL